eukprot:m.128295 g.128295  ORF g.128295 m.128295 type:complete len:277 (-) comp9747_c0_seq3:38-868(-)
MAQTQGRRPLQEHTAMPFEVDLNAIKTHVRSPAEREAARAYRRTLHLDEDEQAGQDGIRRQIKTDVHRSSSPRTSFMPSQAQSRRVQSAPLHRAAPSGARSSRPTSAWLQRPPARRRPMTATIGSIPSSPHAREVSETIRPLPVGSSALDLLAKRHPKIRERLHAPDEHEKQDKEMEKRRRNKQAFERWLARKAEDGSLKRSPSKYQSYSDDCRDTLRAKSSKRRDQAQKAYDEWLAKKKEEQITARREAEARRELEALSISRPAQTPEPITIVID